MHELVGVLGVIAGIACGVVWWKFIGTISRVEENKYSRYAAYSLVILSVPMWLLLVLALLTNSPMHPMAMATLIVLSATAVIVWEWPRIFPEKRAQAQEEQSRERQ